MHKQLRTLAHDLRQQPKLSLQKKAELLKIISGLTRLKEFTKESQGQDVMPMLHRVVREGLSEMRSAAQTIDRQEMILQNLMR